MGTYIPWSQRFSLKFFFAKETASREAAKRERKTFFSLSSLLRDSSPLRCSLSLSRRKISRKTFGTRVLGTRLSGKFPADKTGPFLAWRPIKTQNSLHLANSRNQPCNIQIIPFYSRAGLNLICKSLLTCPFVLAPSARCGFTSPYNNSELLYICTVGSTQ